MQDLVNDEIILKCWFLFHFSISSVSYYGAYKGLPVLSFWFASSAIKQAKIVSIATEYTDMNTIAIAKENKNTSYVKINLLLKVKLAQEYCS